MCQNFSTYPVRGAVVHIVLWWRISRSLASTGPCMEIVVGLLDYAQYLAHFYYEDPCCIRRYTCIEPDHSARSRCHSPCNYLAEETTQLTICYKIICNKNISLQMCSIQSQVTIKVSIRYNLMDTFVYHHIQLGKVALLL